MHQDSITVVGESQEICTLGQKVWRNSFGGKSASVSVNETAPLFHQVYCKPESETFLKGLLHLMAVILWGLTQQHSVAFPALGFTSINFCS